MENHDHTILTIVTRMLFEKKEHLIEQHQDIRYWLASDPENSEKLDNWIKAWKQVEFRERPVSISGVDRRIKAHMAQGRVSASTPKTRYLWYSRAAAAILLIGLSSLFMLYLFGWQEKTALEYQTRKAEWVTHTLPDGTVIRMNSDSRLTYTETGSQRTVNLSGEVFFEVFHDSIRPFKVIFPDYEVVVTGTSFNVRAYPDDTDQRVTLLTGSISIEMNESSPISIQPGHQFIYDKIDRVVRSALVNPVEVTAWRSQVLRFDETSFHEVATMLSRWYDIEIRVENPALNRCRLTATFLDATLEEVIETIEFLTDVRVDVTGKNVVISGRGCASI